jgi:hypothetical protein
MSDISDEPVFRTLSDAKKQDKGSKVLNRPISKKPKTKARPVKRAEPEPAQEQTIKDIDPNLLDIINEDLPLAKIKQAAEEIVKNENQLEKSRSKGETKKIVLEKPAPVQKKVVNNFEIVFMKNDYKPKGNPESAEKCKDFTNKLFNRREVRRLPLAQILKK